VAGGAVSGETSSGRRRQLQFVGLLSFFPPRGAAEVVNGTPGVVGSDVGTPLQHFRPLTATGKFAGGDHNTGGEGRTWLEFLQKIKFCQGDTFTQIFILF